MKQFLAILSLLSAGASSIASGSECPMHPDAPPELSKNHDCCRIAQEEWDATVKQIKATDLSLFQIESRWTNQNGSAAPFAQIAGKPQLVALAYTNCQYACPRILADLKSIENSLSKLPDGSYGIVLVTIDPERDTPEQFSIYAEKNKLDPNRWTLLSSQSADILELANLLGVRYQKMSNGEFTHSNIITLLNSEGEIEYQQNGLGADSEPTIAKLKELLR